MFNHGISVMGRFRNQLRGMMESRFFRSVACITAEQADNIDRPGWKFCVYLLLSL
jgi:hypothetical protein